MSTVRSSFADCDKAMALLQQHSFSSSDSDKDDDEPPRSICMKEKAPVRVCVIRYPCYFTAPTRSQDEPVQPSVCPNESNLIVNVFTSSDSLKLCLRENLFLLWSHATKRPIDCSIIDAIFSTCIQITSEDISLDSYQYLVDGQIRGLFSVWAPKVTQIIFLLKFWGFDADAVLLQGQSSSDSIFLNESSFDNSLRLSRVGRIFSILMIAYRNFDAMTIDEISSMLEIVLILSCDRFIQVLDVSQMLICSKPEFEIELDDKHITNLHVILGRYSYLDDRNT